MNSACASVIIPAAGSGMRMGGISKQLLEVCGKTIIEYTVWAFEKSEKTGEIIICAKADELCRIRDIVKKYPKVKAVVEGGATRRESVKMALEHCDFEYVAIHDGDRPLILPHDIDNIISQAQVYGAVCTASPIADTLKRSDSEGFIKETVPRDMLYGAQTPQVFKTAEYIEVSKKHAESFTDDASLMEKEGYSVHLVSPGAPNIKLTHFGDLEIITAIIKKRREEGVYDL